MKMKAILALALIMLTLICIPGTVFAAETETETDSTVTEQQQKGTRPSFMPGKRCDRPVFDGEKKPAALPEGVRKPDMSKIKGIGFANFKKNQQGSYP